MKKPLLIILFVISVLNITSCNSKQDEIVIGLNYEGSGALAPYGRAMLDGARLAVEEINASGGINGRAVRLEKADNRSVGADSAAAVLFLKSVKKADVIIGPATSTLAKAALCVDAQALIISPSATADELSRPAHRGDTRFVRICFCDSVQGAAMGRYAAEQGFKRAAVLTDMSSDYSNGCAKAFAESFSGDVVFEGRFLSGDTDFSALVTQLGASGADCVYLPAYYTEAGLIIRQSREQGQDIPFLGGDAMDSPYLVDVIGKKEYVRDILYTDHFTPKDDRYREFAQKYLDRYGETPPAYSALAYDCVMLYCNAVQRAGNIQSAKTEIYNTKSYIGITGEITIKENGDCDKQPVFASPTVN